METQILLLKDLVVDSCFQSRIGINKDVVNEYGGLVADGVPFPPIQVVKASKHIAPLGVIELRQEYKRVIGLLPCALLSKQIKVMGSGYQGRTRGAV